MIRGAFTFVLFITLLHPAILVALHLSGRDLRTLSLAYLSISTLIYIWYLVNIAYPFFFSPFSHLPQPPSGTFYSGHLPLLERKPPGGLLLKWIRQTPNNGLIHFRGFMQDRSRLLLTTPDAISEVLNAKPYDWQKPAPARRYLKRVLGEGLIVVEGRDHKIQRKSVAPAFQGKNIRDLIPTFWSKAIRLADEIGNQMELDQRAYDSKQSQRTGVIEINQIASRIALDIIGKAALGKEMDTIIDPSDELAQQYSIILSPDKGNMGLFVLMNMFAPMWFVRHFPWKMNQRIAQAELNLRGICRKLIAEKRAAIEERNIQEKDILSVLIRSGNFDDDGLVDQLLTFMAAGHETTAGGITWACYLLSLHPDVQTKLRQEIQNVVRESGSDSRNIDGDTIESIPYLSAVCSEVMRLFPTVPVTARESIRATTIGDQVIPKGTFAIICQWAINRLPSLWGADAEDFKPERWMPGKGNPQTGGADSRYSFLTFLHGPRSCIGQGFAVTELKCLLAALVLKFTFELAREADRDVGLEPAGFITIKPKHGLLLRLREIA